ncbi:LptF/LptG family permease [Candidatus Pelagibacter sp. HIMB1517]|uniref:LptF/LptG family permease n=1 Tax=Candidatus Pelagibacter sp. HIMB1517 TaxID=3413341 RepID=UPI003F832DCF
MVKNKIYKYFFVEFFKIFLLISLSLSLLIWMTQAARLLELVTEYGNSLSIYLKYLIFIYPKIFDNIFLLSFLVSILFLINKLEESKELSIYWLSGIDKKKIVNLVIYISIITIFLNILLSAIIAPWSSLKGRELLANSKFTLVNSLVKENNFNTPLKGLTVYVEENDLKGNLKNIFIYEETRTIIAKKGQVLSDDQNNYLKLYDGTVQEKTNDNINIINFNTTIFDFSKFKLQNTIYPKYSERNIFWLIRNYNNDKIKSKEVREEINKRTIKPFLMLMLGVLSCFLIYENKKKQIKYYKLIIYILSFFLIILNQIALSISGKSLIYSASYFCIIILCFSIIFILLNKKLEFEFK